MYIADKLEKLYSLFQKGVLTQSEYQQQKTSLLLQQREMPIETPIIPFGRAYGSYWKNSFHWSGRATRAEYWWPTIGNMIISFGFSFMTGLTHMGIFFLLSIIFGIACIFPTLSVWVRRAHDLGKSAKFAFLPLILDLFLAAFLVIFAIAGQVIDYSSRDNPMETFQRIRSLVFICGGFMLVVCGFWTIIWSVMLAFIPGQPVVNKYGDPK